MERTDSGVARGSVSLARRRVALIWLSEPSEAGMFHMAEHHTPILPIRRVKIASQLEDDSTTRTEVEPYCSFTLPVL